MCLIVVFVFVLHVCGVFVIHCVILYGQFFCFVFFVCVVVVLCVCALLLFCVIVLGVSFVTYSVMMYGLFLLCRCCVDVCVLMRFVCG